jgi:hypothetical protein
MSYLVVLMEKLIMLKFWTGTPQLFKKNLEWGLRVTPRYSLYIEGVHVSGSSQFIPQRLPFSLVLFLCCAVPCSTTRESLDHFEICTDSNHEKIQRSTCCGAAQRIWISFSSIYTRRDASPNQNYKSGIQWFDLILIKNKNYG